MCDPCFVRIAFHKSDQLIPITIPFYIRKNSHKKVHNVFNNHKLHPCTIRSLTSVLYSTLFFHRFQHINIGMNLINRFWTLFFSFLFHQNINKLCNGKGLWLMPTEWEKCCHIWLAKFLEIKICSILSKPGLMHQEHSVGSNTTSVILSLVGNFNHKASKQEKKL